MNPMTVTSIIQVVLPLLQGVLAEVQKNPELPAEIIADVEAAVAALVRVHGSDVTFAQLEGLRIQPKW